MKCRAKQGNRGIILQLNVAFPMCVSEWTTEVFLTGHRFLPKTGLRKGVWRDWCSEMSKASQLPVVTDTRDEAGRTGPVMFGTETDSSPGACRALDRGPPLRAQAALRALPPAHCQTASKREHRRCAQHQVVCCRYPNSIINTEQEEYTWVVWGISNPVFAFFFNDLIAPVSISWRKDTKHPCGLPP